MPEAAQKVMPPPEQDTRFSRTVWPVHAKPPFFEPTASDTAGATANATCYHIRRKASPDYGKCSPLKYRHPMPKCRSEKCVPLRQNACNFWPLKKCTSISGKNDALVRVKRLLFENLPSRADKTICFQTWCGCIRLQKCSSGNSVLIKRKGNAPQENRSNFGNKIAGPPRKPRAANNQISVPAATISHDSQRDNTPKG